MFDSIPFTELEKEFNSVLEYQTRCEQHYKIIMSRYMRELLFAKMTKDATCFIGNSNYCVKDICNIIFNYLR